MKKWNQLKQTGKARRLVIVILDCSKQFNQEIYENHLNKITQYRRHPAAKKESALDLIRSNMLKDMKERLQERPWLWEPWKIIAEKLD